MAVRTDFTAGEVLAAADLNDTFASKLPYSYGTATPSTSDDGFLWYDSNSTPAEVKFWDGAAFQALTSGKILQVVRATDTTDRSTTSTSYVDVTGMSVTISPTKNTSALLIVAVVKINTGSDGTSGNPIGYIRLADSSNNALSGAEEILLGGENIGTNTAMLNAVNQIAYVTPATTSAVTYKLRFRVPGSNRLITAKNADSTGQMYAIEVSA